MRRPHTHGAERRDEASSIKVSLSNEHFMYLSVGIAYDRIAWCGLDSRMGGGTGCRSSLRGKTSSR